VTSYIQTWLNSLVTVFGNAVQTNEQKKNLRTKEEKFGNVKIAHFGHFFLFLERKGMLTLEINKNEVERARLVKEANFPAFTCTAKINFTNPY